MKLHNLLLITASTYLAFLLACFAVAEEPKAPLKPNDLTLSASTSGTILTFNASAETSTITARYLVIVQSNGGEPIVRIGELPYERVINNPANGFFITNPYRYLRPKKPEELKIELWTEDGKKWEPVWREVKP